ncbi:MAG: hypothetical protein ABA06_00360 [Parcubacteria bacterium C7867-001]|nr:MAG: hypothetical protein ABA06_00360 [Parcubacteria bacterium C7867-001]
MDMDVTNAKEFLEYVIRQLVDHPDEVSIVPTLDNFGVLLTLKVHKDDMGKLIGKGGKFATETIRPLMKAYGYKHGANISVKLAEPVGGKRYSEAPELKSVDEALGEL